MLSLLSPSLSFRIIPHHLEWSLQYVLTLCVIAFEVASRVAAVTFHLELRMNFHCRQMMHPDLILRGWIALAVEAVYIYNSLEERAAEDVHHRRSFPVPEAHNRAIEVVHAFDEW